VPTPRSRLQRAALAVALLAFAPPLAESVHAQTSGPARSGVPGAPARNAMEPARNAMEPARNAVEPARLSTAKPKSLGVGQVAPEFALIDQTGRERVLLELLGEAEFEQSALLLLFYGRDFEPAATALLRSWKERLAQFEGTPPRVVGISSDDTERNASFHAFLDLPFELLSDPEQRVAKLYGASPAPAAGSTGAAESAPHAAFLVNAKGHVIYLDRDFRATPGEDFRTLLRALLLQTPRPASPSAQQG
jgi:peroxiredoxin Q/BCP